MKFEKYVYPNPHPMSHFGQLTVGCWVLPPIQPNPSGEMTNRPMNLPFINTLIEVMPCGFSSLSGPRLRSKCLDLFWQTKDHELADHVTVIQREVDAAERERAMLQTECRTLQVDCIILFISGGNWLPARM
jgi:hypothetical protein